MNTGTGKENPQDRILNQLRRKKAPCVIHLANGFQIKGAIVRAFDNFVIVIETEGKQMMLYKHGISSITMITPVALDASADEAQEKQE
ncbi:MAG TPA: RNA chaperone Hfq [Feifaniaceae bacterium]|nr:RNA chaperone Hfq [Feifaniaceae bacterium]